LLGLPFAGAHQDSRVLSNSTVDSRITQLILRRVLAGDPGKRPQAGRAQFVYSARSRAPIPVSIFPTPPRPD
jgi:hypothetical protein